MLALGLDKPSLLVSCVAREKGQKKGQKKGVGQEKRGVMGNNRTYKICARMVDASDGMRAVFAYEQRVSRRTINEVAGINSL